MNKQTVFEIIRKNFLQLLTMDGERVCSRSSAFLDSLLEHDWSELFGKPKPVLNDRQAEVLYKRLRLCFK